MGYDKSCESQPELFSVGTSGSMAGHSRAIEGETYVPLIFCKRGNIEYDTRGWNNEGKGNHLEAKLSRDF